MKIEDLNLISVVIPCFNEEESVAPLIKELEKVLKVVPNQYEIILVDDGSSDGTWAEILRVSNDSIKGIRLSRNFGQQLAYRAGLEMSRGEVVITMDADLQDPPSLIPEMLLKWQEGFKTVYAQRRSRTSDSITKRFFAAVFYKVISKLSDTKIPAQVGEFRLMDRCVVDAVLRMTERRPFLRGMVAWVGFSSTAVLYDRPPRLVGLTKFPFHKSLQLAIDGITAFSFAPLRIGLRVGFILMALSLISLFGFLSGGLLGFEWQRGVLISGAGFLGGINLFFIGILGEYLTRLFEQTGSRPLYLVAEYAGGVNAK
jgi:glycosyltransferase involved in cell wall biosynthesis